MHTFLIGGLFYERFAIIRQAAIKSSGSYTQLAIMIASMLAVLTLIKMAYDMMSDEQNGGFGGVTLKQIIRPVVVVGLIVGYQTWLGAFDTLFSKLSISLATSSKSVVEGEPYKNVMNAISAIDARYATGTTGRNAKTIADETWEKAKTAITDNLKENGGEVENEDLESWARSQGYDNFEGYEKTWKDEFTQLVRTYSKTSWDVIGHQGRFGGNWIAGILAAIIWFFYDFVFRLVQATAELFLCVFALLGPITLALSMLDRWKDAPLNFISKYFEITMWKVTASILKYVGDSAVGHVYHGANDIALETIRMAETGVIPSDAFALTGSVITALLLEVAVILAVTQVPSLTSAVLNINSSPAVGDGGVGRAVSTMAGGFGLVSIGKSIASGLAGGYLNKKGADLVGKKK